MGDSTDLHAALTAVEEVEAQVQELLDQTKQGHFQRHLRQMGLDGNGADIIEALNEERIHDLRVAGVLTDDRININNQDDLAKYIEETQEFAEQCNRVEAYIANKIASETVPGIPRSHGLINRIKEVGDDIIHSTNQLAVKGNLGDVEISYEDMTQELSDVKQEVRRNNGFIP